MAVEMLNYAELAARLKISPGGRPVAAKRLRLPRSRGNDGKALVSVDLAEINHAPLPARSPAGHLPESQDRNVAGRTRKAGGSGGWSPGGLRVGARPRAKAEGRVPEDDRRHHDSERSHGAARGRASSTEGAAVVASACRVTSSYLSRQWSRTRPTRRVG